MDTINDSPSVPCSTPLVTLARAVKQGAALLDKKIPSWRRVLKHHRQQFDFRGCDHCILGTVGRFAPELKALRKQATFDAFGDSLAFLVGRKMVSWRDESRPLGFDSSSFHDYPTLVALWSAETGIDLPESGQ